MGAKKEGVRRHLEGWEFALVAVVVALMGTLLAVPLRALPEDVPLPMVDERRLAEKQKSDDELAFRVFPLLERDIAAGDRGNEVENEGRRFYDLRAFGEIFRDYGRAEMSSDMYEVVRTRKKLLDAVNRARSLGDDKLLGVRAYQRQRFIAELARWEETSRPSDELVGLAGSFLSLAARFGWIEQGKLRMDDVVRGVFFVRRWNELTGLTEPPYGLSLDESRSFYRFLLTRTYIDAPAAVPAKDACRMTDEWRLRKIDELAHIDPLYPSSLARGVLLYRIGSYPAAVTALRQYLDAPRDGLYILRARNYLAEANARAGELANP
jgi:hypothetical protein